MTHSKPLSAPSIDLLDRSFHFSRYMGVNYMMVLKKVLA